MAILEGIFNTYALFFDIEMWINVFTDPVSWGLIGSLIILEGLLSADNALVLAVMVKHLPEQQRRKALFYGIIGAYVFRFIAIGIGVYLIELWWVKVFGASYLAWLAISYFLQKYKQVNLRDNEEKIVGINENGLLVRLFGTFWGTVIAVELVDIAFSIDSVLAAFGVSEQVWVLLLGGMLGVLMMRGVAGLFIKLIGKIPELESAAYIVILAISGKMFISLTGYELPNKYFFTILITVFIVTFFVHYIKNKSRNA